MGVEGIAIGTTVPAEALPLVGGVPERQDRMLRLSREIRTLETAGRPTGSLISSGCPAMDACLPGGGYALGSMVELVHGGGGCRHAEMPVRGVGTLSLAMRLGMEAMAGGKYMVLIDHQRQFYIPGVLGLGVPSERLIVLQPKTDADAIWGIDQSLRNTAVGAVVAMLHRLEDRVARRLQLATEQGGGLGILVRDAQAARRYPSWSEVQWRVRAALPVSSWQTRWFDMELSRASGARVGTHVRVGLGSRGEWVMASEKVGNPHEATGALHLAAQLAQPALRRRHVAG